MSHSGKRIVNMVLYSRSFAYDEMYKITREYYKRFDNVLTLYYLFSESDREPYIEEDILYLPGNETYIPGILDKTMTAFSYIWKNYPNYDYYIRTNISTIVDINQFLKRVEREPIEYGGFVICLPDGYRDPVSGIDDNRFVGTTYATGTLIIFSNNLFKRIIDHSHQVDRTVIDDVAIGILARNVGAVPVHISEYGHNVNIPISTPFIIYRNQTFGDRRHDVEQMREIIKYI
jgi:hypothetical protein